jgi:AmmeMemoRadiSam system protein A
LRKSGDLRGCIGSTAARLPLEQAVAAAAYSASREDPRFDPVNPAELPLIDVEISVLSPFVEIRPEEIVVGRHGLMISSDFARGLLLPQVAEERHWSAERFLEETCRKAGLPAGAWKHGARIQAFTAEVFGEGELGTRKHTE